MTSLAEHLNGIQKKALTAGAVLLGLTALGAFADPSQFFRSYLLGFLLWVSAALGAFALLMLHYMVGGRWGFVARRILEASTRTFPVLAVMFVPILLGMHHLYEWTHLDVVARDPLLQHKSVYLNTGFFAARTAFYFALWIGMSWVFAKLSAEQDRSGGYAVLRRIQVRSAPGLLLYGLTATFASIDWIMSLEPHWYSAVFGLSFMVGQALLAMALVFLAVSILQRHEPLRDVATPAIFHDWANLMLAFVMLWSYMAFSQFLIIWSGNLPEEIPWYLDRTVGGWQVEALLLIVFHFALPFALLLSRGFKRSKLLPRLALAIVVARLLDFHFLTAPGFSPKQFHFHWMDLTAPAALGCLWIAAVAWQLRKLPLLPERDWRFEGEEGAVPERALSHD